MIHDFMTGGYVKLPTKIIHDKQLESLDIRLYCVLTQLCGIKDGHEHPVAWSGQEILCEELSLSKRTLRRSISRLEKAGYIKSIQRGLGLTNEYELVESIKFRSANDKNGSFVAPRNGQIGTTESATSGPFHVNRDKEKEKQSITNTPHAVGFVLSHVPAEQSMLEPVMVAKPKRRHKSELEPQIAEQVDKILATFNELSDKESYHLGEHRSAAAADLIAARLLEEAKLPGGNLERATTCCVSVVRAYYREWRKNEQNVAMFANWRVSTLFRPDKWADRVAFAREWWDRYGQHETPGRQYTQEWADKKLKELEHTDRMTFEERRVYYETKRGQRNGDGQLDLLTLAFQAQNDLL